MTGNLWTTPIGDAIAQTLPYDGLSSVIRIEPLTGGGAAIAWSPYVDFSNYESYVKVIDSAGAEVVSAFNATDNWSFSNHLHDLTATPDGGFLVNSDVLDGHQTAFGVASRLFSSAGVNVGTNRANTTVDGMQSDSDSAALTGGGHVTVWTDELLDGAGAGVFGQMFNASGANVGPTEFQVNTTATGDQGNAVVVGLADGGFGVVWTVLYEFYYQRFDASGAKVGGEVHLTPDTAYGSIHPRIDVLTDGNIVLTWTEKETAAHDSGNGVFARIIDADGAPVTGIIKVDPDYSGTEPEGQQAEQAVTALADGGFMVSWEDDNVDGVAGNYGIVARRFDKTGDPIGDQFTVAMGGKDSVSFSGEPAAPITQTNDGTVIFAWLDETGLTGGTRQVNTRSFDLASYIVGTNGDDWMDTGTSGNDTIKGLDGRDWLFGFEGDDLLDGGDGGGELAGGPGNDTLRGGDGVDSAWIEDSLDNIEVVRGAGGLQITSADGIDFVHDTVDEFFFSDGTGGNEFRTYAQIEALGTPARDIAFDSYTVDFVDRPDGSSRVGDNLSVDVTLSNTGSQPVSAGAQVGVYLGQMVAVSTADTQLGVFDLAEIPAGGTLDVTLDVTLPSGLEERTYYLGLIADPSNALDESDEANNAPLPVPVTVSLANVVPGSDAAETVNGTAADEVIYAEGGSDWIIPGEGNDTVWGGHGNDMVSYSSTPEVPGRGTNFMVDLDLGAGTANVFGGEVDQLMSIERVTGSIFADVLRGSDGNDELRGIGDYDWFVATPGQDTLNGGNGLDMVTFLEAQSSGASVVQDIFATDGVPPTGAAVGGVLLDLADGSNNTGLAAGLTLISVERVTGSSHQDVFFGDDQQNDFRGLGGFDWFVSSTGGRERYYGGDGVDTVTYFNSGSGVIASLRNGAGEFGGQETGYGSAGDAIRDLYFEIENLVGSDFDDRLEGNRERNDLVGRDGDDYLLGYGNTDYLKGGAGNDTLDGGAGSDFALFDGNRADYTLTRTSSTEVTIAGPDGTDSLINVEYFQFDDQTANIWELSII